MEDKAKIIKGQIKELVKWGYIYEVGKGKYRGLDKNSNFYLEIRGEI